MAGRRKHVGGHAGLALSDPSDVPADEVHQDAARPIQPWSVAHLPDFLEFVRVDLRFQAALGASAYLVPGPMRTTRSSEKAAGWTLRASEVASDEALKLGRPRPLVSFVGIHSQNLQLGQQIAEQLSHAMDSLYIQVSPVDPQRDSTDKLVGLLGLLTGLEQAGRTVIGGHLGAIEILLRALGVSAADAGMGSSESFSLSRFRRSRRTVDPGKRSGTNLARRRYVRQLHRSVDPATIAIIESVPNAQAMTSCDACCRFYAPSDRVSRGREHSLIQRLTEASEVTTLPPSMRLDYVDRQLGKAQATLTAVNTALTEAGYPALGAEYLDNQLATLRALARRQAA